MRNATYISSEGSFTLSPSGGDWSIRLLADGMLPGEFFIVMDGSYILEYDISVFPSGWSETLLPWNSGTHTLEIYYTATESVACGSIGGYGVRITKVSGLIHPTALGEGEIKIVNENISGNFDVCGLNTTNTYTLYWDGYLSSNGNHTWSLSTYTGGWKINGAASSYTGSSNSVTITTPASAGNATLTVSGDNLCTNYNKTIYAASVVPANPSNSITSMKIGSSCYYKVTVPEVATATSYKWSLNSSFSCSVITTTNYTDDVCGDLLAGESAHIYVKAINGCGQSVGYGHKLLSFPEAPGCMLKALPINETDEISIEDFFIATYENETINIFYPGFAENDNTQVFLYVYDLKGRLIYKFAISNENSSFEAAEFMSGIYIAQLIYENEVTTRKMFVK